jgi:exodeoxyribonuclease VII small subunit
VRSGTPFGDPPPADEDPDVVRWRRALDAGVFEEAFAALEEVVDRLERGGLRLEDTLSCYALGVRLAERCRTILDEAQLRVTRLEESLDAVESWDDSGFAADDAAEDDETG